MNPPKESQGRSWLLSRTATFAEVGASQNRRLSPVSHSRGRRCGLPMAGQHLTTSFWPQPPRETVHGLFLPSIGAWRTLVRAAGHRGNNCGCRLCHFLCRHHLAPIAQVALKGLVSNMRAPWRAQPLRRPSPQTQAEVMPYGRKMSVLRQPAGQPFPLPAA